MTPRDIIQRALADAPDFTSAQMLHARLLVTGQRIGLTTVYRVLHNLIDAGRVDMIRDPERPTRGHALRYAALAAPTSS